MSQKAEQESPISHKKAASKKSILNQIDDFFL